MSKEMGIWLKLRKKITSFARLAPILVREFYKGYFQNISSFSQFGEDLELLGVLGKSKGIFIDVGSGRPVSGSNTWMLYKLGWSGISIDPLKSNMFLHKLLRPRDRFIRAIIGPEARNIDFWETFPYEYSSTDKNLVSKLFATNKAQFVNCYLVESIPINRIFENTKDVRLLCIDAEGMDFEILRNLDFDKYRPELICIEDHEYTQEKSQIKQLMIENNYRLEKNKHPSYIYCRND
jgi:hypothetical protein